MANKLVAGLAAGAAGTVALNVATYLDMLLRGRPASSLPAEVAGRLASEMGLSLDFEEQSSEASEVGEGAGGGNPSSSSSERVANRQQGLGALLGYANGLGIGLAYGLIRLGLPRMPLWMTGAVLGSAAMAASDVPATRLGLTDPQQWQAADWAADVLPHLAYGVVTAITFEALRD